MKKRKAKEDAGLEPELMRLGLEPERPIAVEVHRYKGRGTVRSDMHHAHEVGIVVSGRFERNHGRGWFCIGEGQAWVNPSFQAHRWRVTADGTKTLVFVFLPTLSARLPALAGFDPLAVLRSPLQSEPIGKGIAFRRSLLQLAREISRKYAKRFQPGPACIDLMRTLELLSEALPHSAAAQGRQPFSFRSGSRKLSMILRFSTTISASMVNPGNRSKRSLLRSRCSRSSAAVISKKKLLPTCFESGLI